MDDSVQCLAYIPIFETLFWWFLSAALSYAIQQLQIGKPDLPSVDPDTLATPTTKEGTEYTIGFGTFWIDNPVVAWWGDVWRRPYVKHYTYNKWFNNKREYYIAGWLNYIGVHYIYTQGVNDGPKQIKGGDVVLWPDSSDPTVLAADGITEIEIDEAGAYGGWDAQGGFIGTIDVEYGEASQVPNDYLQEQLGTDISANRGLSAFVLRQCYMGMVATPRSLSVMWKRTDVLTDGTAQWYGAKSDIYGSLNPIHMLREIYTNTEWGFAKPTARFSEGVWRAAADTLYDEEFGLSMKWETPKQTLESFKDDILRHIDGFVYQEPSTGEYVIKLVRDDYDAGTLDVYDESDVAEVTQFTRGAVYQAANHIRVRFWDSLNNVPVVVGYQNTALMDLQGGGVIVMDVDYLGVTRPELASKLLAREVYQASGFFASMIIKGKRNMQTLRPGDVFKFSWPPLGLEEVVLRVLSMDLGTLQDGLIELKCVEDMFAVQGTAYAVPPDTGWDEGPEDPPDVEEALLYEVPFYTVAKENGVTEALAFDNDTGFLAVCCGLRTAFAGVDPTNPHAWLVDYAVFLRESPSSEFYLDGRSFFTPAGSLSEYIPCNAADVTIDIEGINAADAQGIEEGQFAQIGNEIVKVLTKVGQITSTTYRITIARGCLDTVPEYHAGENSAEYGAPVWFSEAVSYYAKHEFTSGDQPGVKVCPFQGYLELDVDDATAHNADVFNSRMVRPYPPGNFKINSVSYPSTFSGQPTLSWAHRDRTQQLDEITEHSDASIGPEAGTTYSIKVYDENNALVRTVTGLTGTSWEYTWEMEMDDCGLDSGDDLNDTLRFQLWSVRDGYASWQHYDIVVQRV